VNWRNNYPYGNALNRPGSFDFDSPIYGGQLGIQTQRGNWVFGLETSLSGTTDRERSRGIDLWAGNAVGDMTVRVDWLLMAVGRIGYAWGNTLGYVKGGYAGAEIRLETSDNVPPIFTSASSKWHNGWTVGAGFEYLWFPNVTVGLEYNFVSLDGANRTTSIVGPGGTFRSNADLDLHTVLARLNFKFDFVGGNP
jgi:outer membrane immunogenic protein